MNASASAIEANRGSDLGDAVAAAVVCAALGKRAPVTVWLLAHEHARTAASSDVISRRTERRAMRPPDDRMRDWTAIQGPEFPLCGYGGRSMAIIEIEGLRKEYRRLRGGRTVAVAGLDLAVQEGGVFGFLGP